jgi:hypothetical protein
MVTITKIATHVKKIREKGRRPALAGRLVDAGYEENNLENRQ